MDYSGPNSLFIRILLDKKYALPYKVVDLDRIEATMAASFKEHAVCALAPEKYNWHIDSPRTGGTGFPWKTEVHLYEALKKALYKPAPFFKGILFPLCEVSRYVSYTVKQDTLEVHPDFRRLQVGNKDLGAGVGSVRCPLGGFGKGEQLRPVRQRGVLLDACREDMRSNGGKLNVHLYEALKKALYKPAPFFKGILFRMSSRQASSKTPSRYTRTSAGFKLETKILVQA
jgi:hypothetical protein